MAPTPPKRLVIFCDGTWCGRETGTYSNIRALADMTGTVDFSDEPGQESTTKVFTVETHQGDVTAGYQEGVGLNKTFLEYIWDGATASTIGEECTSVYKFIVDHYTSDHEIWMFAFSRGSFTVRCVAGMINNCGIIKKQNLNESEISLLCREVYRTYRSPLDIDHPKSPRCTRLRNDPTRVWPAKRPIRLMCVADTVGALGIPRLNAGVGFDWPEFYDQQVSTVVQEMYHAPALHDRLWIFQPCLAYNGPGPEQVKIHQTWFPGCHYDLGRQSFRFLRQAPANQVERILGAIPARLSKTIYPNEVLSDLLLRWILQAVQRTEQQDERTVSLIPDIDSHIQVLSESIASPTSTQPTGPTGSGDIYGDVLEYAPGYTLWGTIMKFGNAAVDVLNRVWPKLGDNIQDLLGIKTILQILTATRDRRIPGTDADIYPYKDEEMVSTGEGSKRFTVEVQARMKDADPGRGVRYPSLTYESYELWQRVFGV